MKAQSPNILKKHAFASICVGIALLLGVATFYRSSAIPEAEIRLEEKTAEGQRLQNNIKNAAQLKEHQESLAATNEEAAKRLINPSQLGENLQFFYRIESASGTKILDLRQVYTEAKGQKEPPRFVPVPFVMTVQGDYSRVQDFIRRVEKSTHFVRLTSASMMPVGLDADADAQTVSANLTVELLGTP